MAKYKFTQAQFDEIWSLLKRRPKESREDQKKTRAKIRKLGFMISDYFNGFSEIDFKNLLMKGEVEITAKQNSASKTPISKNTVPDQSKLRAQSNILKQGLAPVVDKTTEYLILGTMPGEESLLNQEYYNNPRNQFWLIMSSALNNGKKFSDYRDKLKILKENKIGLWDVLDTCERKGSQDSHITNQTLNNFDKLFKEFPNIKTVIFNGQDSYHYFSSQIKEKTEKKYFQLTSSSSANTHKTLEEKIQEWKTAFII